MVLNRMTIMTGVEKSYSSLCCTVNNSSVVSANTGMMRRCTVMIHRMWPIHLIRKVTLMEKS